MKRTLDYHHWLFEGAYQVADRVVKDEVVRVLRLALGSLP
jgi:hypothetical protein